MIKRAKIDRSVSAEIPDWTREMPRRFWDPGRKLLLTIRTYQIWAQKNGTFAAAIRKWHVLRYRFWSAITGADIPLTCQIGGGLLIPHPNGIVIHPAAKVGVNCLIFQQVTIGSRAEVDGVPELEGHVDVGAGAKVLGPIRVGAHAKIGANAVVVSHVKSGDSVSGIPAKPAK